MAQKKRFPEVSSTIDFPRDERKTLAFWNEQRIFERLTEERKKTATSTFVFYEGPPTANGLPHNGHVLTRVTKDLFPRFHTMRGAYVPRKAGWDTHGLPVEVEVEKALRIHGKKAIEDYGVGPFTDRCIESVFRYTHEWESLTQRIGFWIDLPDAYVTYHRSYVESVWWALRDLFQKGLLYRGHKVVWWWAQGGTALSSGEVGLGYKMVDDPSVYVAFPVVGDEQDRALLVWTTTPWTLSSNAYVAVHPDVTYVDVTLGARKLIVAEALVAKLASLFRTPSTEAIVERKRLGSELIGLAYEPPFDLYTKQIAAGTTPYWRVVAGDFVSLDTGTGLVHLAPAFGEDDFAVHRRIMETCPDPEAVPLLCAVRPDGTFVDEFAPYGGMWIKDGDRPITDELDRRGLLVHRETYRHDYPFCWRADEDPLLQYARPTWYVRTTSRVAEAIANNRAVDWHPENIREGRFGDFLAHNVDWALSRERYWGTPLPLWENTALPETDPARYVAIGSVAELREQAEVNLAEVEAALAQAVPDPSRAEHLLVHKPWIDRVTFTRPGVAGLYRRVPEVIDCWFDSGCMPFAQWGFPHQTGSEERFRASFPADFICEAVDQTRGWFYSLLMISTLVFDEAKQQALRLSTHGDVPHPYRTCLVLGHVCDKTGKKESKSKGNYTPPDVILDRVRMEFAVVDEAAIGTRGGAVATAKPGVAWVAREDLEGLDLQEGSAVHVYAEGQDPHHDHYHDHQGQHASAPLTLELRALKGLRRRVVLLADVDTKKLGVQVGPQGVDVMPVEVPRLPMDHRVWIEDPAMPAPGADAFRWFFFASSPPWTNTRHSLGNVRTLQKDFLVKLRNVFSFFTIYANIDEWEPTLPAPPVAERPLLCRWILSELAMVTRDVTEQLERYASYEAAQKLAGFVEALSNWYVRRSRDRFWAPGAGTSMSLDKVAAYATLHHCLLTVAKLAAPFVPFFAEELYQGLAAGVAGGKASVHMEAYPVAVESDRDPELCRDMAALRALVSLGLQVRTAAKCKVRQPLHRADVVLANPALAERLLPHLPLLVDELNVHEVRFLSSGSETGSVRYRIKPNFRTLGPKVGARVQALKLALAALNGGEVRAQLGRGETVQVALDGSGEPIAVTADDVEISVEAAEDYAAADGPVGVVILHTMLDDGLIDEGIAREIQSRLQGLRRTLGLGFTERVEVMVVGSARVAKLIEQARAMVMANALADALIVDGSAFVPDAELTVTVEGEEVRLGLRRSVTQA